MSIVAMIASTLAVTQFIKTAASKVGFNIEKTLAVVVSCVVAAVVVLVEHLKTGTPITLTAIGEWLQVAIGANAGYGLIKVARTPATPTT